MGIYRTTHLVPESPRNLSGNIYGENGVMSKLTKYCSQWYYHLLSTCECRTQYKVFCINLPLFLQLPGKGCPILQKWKGRLREIKQLKGISTANKRQSWELNNLREILTEKFGNSHASSKAVSFRHKYVPDFMLRAYHIGKLWTNTSSSFIFWN